MLHNPFKYNNSSGYAYSNYDNIQGAITTEREEMNRNLGMEAYANFQGLRDMFNQGGSGGGDASTSGNPDDDGYPRTLSDFEKAAFVAIFGGKAPSTEFVVTSGVYGASKWSAGSTGAMQARNGHFSPYYQNSGQYAGANWYGNSDIDLANNINTVHGVVTGLVGGGYGFSSTNVYKYAQQFGSKLASAQALTKLNAINAIRMANVIGRANIITGVIGAGYSLGRYGSDKLNGREARSKDLADGIIGLGGTAIGGAALLGMVSNPIGWGVGIGVGIYFGVRFVYDLNHP